MEKEFVPFEIALKLQQLGFDEPCFGYWLKANSLFGRNDLIIETIKHGKNNQDHMCFAPTWQQAFAFLITEDLEDELTLLYDYSGWSLFINGSFLDYKDEKALKKLIKIKEKNNGKSV